MLIPGARPTSRNGEFWLQVTCYWGLAALVAVCEACLDLVPRWLVSDCALPKGGVIARKPV
jgi:hypothetical protein